MLIACMKGDPQSGFDAGLTKYLRAYLYVRALIRSSLIARLSPLRLAALATSPALRGRNHKLLLPRDAGEGDHAKHGGGGVAARCSNPNGFCSRTNRHLAHPDHSAGEV